MSDYLGSDTEEEEVSSSEDNIPFVRYALGKLLNGQDECIDDNDEVWYKIKNKLKYYANLMYNMNQDSLWELIMETAKNYKMENDIPEEVDLSENAGINFALEKYKHALIDIGESIMDDESNEEVETADEETAEEEAGEETEEEYTDEEMKEEQTGAGRFPFYRTKGYSVGLMRRN